MAQLLPLHVTMVTGLWGPPLLYVWVIDGVMSPHVTLQVCNATKGLLQVQLNLSQVATQKEDQN